LPPSIANLFTVFLFIEADANTLLDAINPSDAADTSVRNVLLFNLLMSIILIINF